MRIARRGHVLDVLFFLMLVNIMLTGRLLPQPLTDLLRHESSNTAAVEPVREEPLPEAPVLSPVEPVEPA